MNMQIWKRFLSWSIELAKSALNNLPMRTSFFVVLIIGAGMVWYATQSSHPLAQQWISTLGFEYGNRFLCLVMLYISHRLINSEMRSHDLLDKAKNNTSSPVYVAWCATWVLSCALIIAFVS